MIHNLFFLFLSSGSMHVQNTSEEVFSVLTVPSNKSHFLCWECSFSFHAELKAMSPTGASKNAGRLMMCVLYTSAHRTGKMHPWDQLVFFCNPLEVSRNCFSLSLSLHFFSISPLSNDFMHTYVFSLYNYELMSLLDINNWHYSCDLY